MSLFQYLLAGLVLSVLVWVACEIRGQYRNMRRNNGGWKGVIIVLCVYHLGLALVWPITILTMIALAIAGNRYGSYVRK